MVPCYSLLPVTRFSPPFYAYIFLNSSLPDLSLYIHIPWCIKKCPYCDFNSHELKPSVSESKYIETLLSDFEQDCARFNIDRPFKSIFIGGGTPSLFSPESFERLLTGLRARSPWSEDIEITLEANPGTFESQKFSEFRALGFNRLSIGVQSFNTAMLTRLGRIHNGDEAIKAAEIAHRAGFTNFNLDLMFGLPDAQEHTSLEDVATAINLHPSHISFYQLTLEPNTYFHKFPPLLPSDDEIFLSQTECQALLMQHGYQQYEISAYSQTGKQCRHNTHYWQFGDYLGIGAGAHGKISQHLPNAIIRTTKPKHPEHYLQHFATQRTATTLLASELPLEFLMNQLRLKQGFSSNDFERHTGLTIKTLEPALSQCLDEQLLKLTDNRYRCTDQGWSFLDSVLEKFIT